MKVIDNALRGLNFEELGVGATFKYGEEYFIKTKELSDEDRVVNAIELEEGIAYNFDAYDKVMPFNCELIIL